MSKSRYYALRIGQTVVMIAIVVTFLFFFFRLMPGDFTSIMIHQGADPETVEQFREDWGLNDPLYVQYWRFILNLATLDAGTSTQFRVPVSEYISTRIFNTFILIAPGITFAYILGSVYGLIAGTNRGSLLEKYGIIPIIFFGAFPSFVISIFLVIIFSSLLDIFPTSGIFSSALRRNFSDAPWWRMYLTKDFAMHYILPFTAVVLRYLLLPSLIMRTSIIEVQEQGFTYYNRIVGLPRMKRLKTLAKHASLPVITLYPVSMTRAIGGLVLIETVFNWPGIGWALVQAVLYRDLPIVQFVFVLVAVFIVVANLVVDLIYGVIDPRVTHGSD